MSPDTLAIVITGAVGFSAQLMTLATIMFNARQARLRREQARDWDVADRAALAAKVLQTSDVLAAKVAATSADLAARVADSSSHLADKVQATSMALTTQIADNTVKTVEATRAAEKAYGEANHVNLKISDLNARLVAKELDGPSGGERPTRETAALRHDTNERIRDIQSMIQHQQKATP